MQPIEREKQEEGGSEVNRKMIDLCLTHPKGKTAVDPVLEEPRYECEVVVFVVAGTLCSQKDCRVERKKKRKDYEGGQEGARSPGHSLAWNPTRNTVLRP